MIDQKETRVKISTIIPQPKYEVCLGVDDAKKRPYLGAQWVGNEESCVFTLAPTTAIVPHRDLEDWARGYLELRGYRVNAPVDDISDILNRQLGAVEQKPQPRIDAGVVDDDAKELPRAAPSFRAESSG